MAFGNKLLSLLNLHFFIILTMSVNGIVYQTIFDNERIINDRMRLVLRRDVPALI